MPVLAWVDLFKTLKLIKEISMPVSINLSQAKENIVNVLEAKLVPSLLGSPGTGKSDLIKSIAAQLKLKVIDLRLSQCDPTDLAGFPTIDDVTGKAGYRPMDTFPIEGDEIPDGYKGWLLFLDEINHAPPAVQKAAYKLILDRQVGMYNLHEKVSVVTAGNLETDNAMVEEMSTALQSRMVHFELAVDAEEWLLWATNAQLDHRVLGYLNWRNEKLHQFDPDHNDRTFACPRTWEFASRLIKGIKTLERKHMAMLAGTISEGVAREFYGFSEIYKDLITIEQIMAAPTTIDVPKEPSVQHALVGSIAERATEANIEKLIQFVRRLPKEFQIICLKQMGIRAPELQETDAVLEWISDSADALF